jgi:hypothetical protein
MIVADDPEDVLKEAAMTKFNLQSQYWPGIMIEPLMNLSG